MPFGDVYYQQAALLIRAIPHVAQEICFALKGGTAINLFIRNMPRLSVDLDLTYLPVEPRPESLAAIDAAIKRIAIRVRAGIGGAQVTETKLEGAVTKLLVRAEKRPDQDRGNPRLAWLRICPQRAQRGSSGRRHSGLR